jgi:hypothetical protein
MRHVEGNDAAVTASCVKRWLAVRTGCEPKIARRHCRIAAEEVPQDTMRDDKIIAACLVDKALGARAFGAAQRLTALMKASGRGLKIECPHVHAA